MPAKFLKPLSDQSPMELTDISFDVTLSKPNHKVKWFLNGNELTSSEKFHPREVDPKRFSLEVDRVLLTDSGIVKCVVYNDKDEEITQTECKLNVQGI